MIKSFKCSETEKIWTGKGSRRLASNIQGVARRKLRMINNATILKDLQIPPANRLEALKGDMLELYSIRVNDQWRICFRWDKGDAYEVRMVDYH